MFYRTFILLFFGVNSVLAQRNIHERWEVQLDQYVAPTGKINYHDWKKEEHALYSYIEALQNHPPQPYWTKSNHKAYWINVYNATTIALILKHYPLQSIKEINTPWKAKVCASFFDHSGVQKPPHSPRFFTVVKYIPRAPQRAQDRP